MMFSVLVGVVAVCVLFNGPVLADEPPSPVEVVQRPAVAGAGAAPDAARGGDLRDFTELYRTDQAALEQFYNLPWAESRFDRLEHFCRETLARLRQVDFDALSQQGRIDYILLRNHLISELGRLARERQKLAEIDDLLPLRVVVLELESARRRMEPVDSQASATKLAALTEQIRKVRERIEQGKQAAPAPEASPPQTASENPGGARNASAPGSSAPPTTPASASPQKNTTGPLKVSPALALCAADAAGALRGTLNEWFGFYNGYQPDFSWWVRKPYEEAGAALDDYARYLRESVAGIHGADDDPLVGDPVGAEALASDLAEEMLPYTPEELIAIAEHDFAWCETEMKKAAAEMGLGDDWKAALAQVKDDHVPPGQQAELVPQQAREVVAFLKQRDLLTIPPLAEETWRLTMISPESQRWLPFAAYGGQNIMVAYASESMKQDDKLAAMRGNNRHVTRVFVAHELIPGHHLQGFMAQRVRPYRGPFSSPFFGEGWALYWEMTLWELGYAQTAEDRIGMLFWRMHRAARVIVSLKFHLRQMTPTEMVDFLVNRVGHERFGALGEARRFVSEGYSPLYPCGYLIGGLQLRALRKELVDSGKLSNRDFHDTLLTYGGIPVELVRAGMLNLPLTRETRSTWRFAGEPHGKTQP